MDYCDLLNWTWKLQEKVNVMRREVEVKAEGYNVLCECYAFSWVASQASDSVPGLYQKARRVINKVR